MTTTIIASFPANTTLSKKYPTRLDAPHAGNLNKFIRDISTTLKNSYPRTGNDCNAYDKAHVLFLRWEQDDLGTQTEIDALREQMEKLRFTREQRNLTTAQYEIPSKDSHIRLEEVLVEKRRHFAMKSEHLLVIYYGGHAEVTRSQHCKWFPWMERRLGIYEKRPEIDWTELQYSSMSRCPGNVLFILDSCYASSTVGTALGDWSGLKEMLVASGKHDVTHGVNNNSFTRALIHELKSMEGSRCSVSALHHILVTKQDHHGLMNTPIHIALSNSGRRFRSVTFSRPFSHWESFPLQDLSSTVMDSGARVLISVRLHNPADPVEINDWRAWLGQAPEEVLDMEVVWRYVRPEAAFHSGSTLLFFSMPVLVWDVLPYDSSYTYIGIVKSENLINSRDWREGISTKAADNSKLLDFRHSAPISIPDTPPRWKGWWDTAQPSTIVSSPPLLTARGEKHHFGDEASGPKNESNIYSSLIDTPLYNAVRQGNAAMVKTLINDCVGIDAKDTFGYTLIHWAVRDGNVAIVKQLIQAGADIDAQDIDGRTALRWAVENGQHVVVERLTEAGANLHIADKDGYTPLRRAAFLGLELVVNTLAKAGADVNDSLLWAVKHECEAMAKLLLGMSIKATDKSRRMPLLWAIQNGNAVLVKQLVEAGADVNEALFWVVEHGRGAMVRPLIAMGADVNTKDNSHRAPLHWAAENGHYATAGQLLNMGANAETKDQYGATPLHWASRNGHEVMVEALAEAGANVGAKDNNGATPLHWAARNGHKAMARRLVDVGADISARDVNNAMPLHWAARNGHKAVVELLVEAGADINAKDYVGNTSLDFAVENRREAIVKMLDKLIREANEANDI